jgi:hypothetical protein
MFKAMRPVGASAAFALSVLILAHGVAHAETAFERQQRLDKTFDDSAKAAEDRSQQLRNTAQSQQDRILYQARRAKRQQLKLQCQMAGQSNC